MRALHQERYFIDIRTIQPLPDGLEHGHLLVSTLEHF
jgi:hypothetical protein